MQVEVSYKIAQHSYIDIYATENETCEKCHHTEKATLHTQHRHTRNFVMSAKTFCDIKTFS